MSGSFAVAFVPKSTLEAHMKPKLPPARPNPSFKRTRLRRSA